MGDQIRFVIFRNEPIFSAEAMEFRKWGETELWKSLPRLENNFLTIFDTAWVDWIEGWAKPGWQRQRIYKLFIYAMRASVDVWTTVCSCRAAEHSIFSWIYTLSKARVAVHIDCTLHGPVAKKMFLDFFFRSPETYLLVCQFFPSYLC